MSHTRTFRIAVFLIGLACLAPSLLAQEQERSQIPDRFKWNLAEIYASDADWRMAKDRLSSSLTELDRFKGQLGSSASTLADAVERFYAIDKELSRLYVYASMLADQDTRDSTHQGMQQEMVRLAAAFGSQASFIEPEILRLPGGTIDKYLAAESRLKPFRFYVEDIARRAPHTLVRRRSWEPQATPTASCRTPIFRTRRSRSATASQ